MALSQKPTLDMLPEIITAKMIAQYLDVGYVKALNLLKYSDLPSIKVGNKYLVSKSKFMEWLNVDEKREYLVD